MSSVGGLPDSLRHPRAACGNAHPGQFGKHPLVCDKPAGHMAHRDSVRDPGCAWQPDVDGMADDIERLTAEIADLRRQLDAAHQRRIRLDTIRWLADCLGLDNHATIAEITIRSSEVIVVRHRTPVVLCEHGGEMHVATVAERIEVNP